VTDNTVYVKDVFVSYACAENSIPNGETKGWVNVFVETLKNELARTVVGRKVRERVWWDESNLDRAAPLHKQILNTLPSVRLMVVLLSPDYLKSQWCTEERETFLNAIRNRLLSDERVFLVDLGQVKVEQRPEPFRELLGFPFHGPDGGKLGHPVPNSKWESHQSFFKEVEKLAPKIAERLEKLGVQSSAEHLRPVPRETVATVYLAQTTDDLDEQREEVASDLMQHDFRVVPDDSLATDIVICRQQIHQWLTESGVFVQLLGHLPGKRFKDSDETLVTLQHRCATNRSPQQPILQWRTKVANVDAVNHSGLKALLANPDVRLEEKVPLEAFKAEVREKATPSKPKQAIPHVTLPGGVLPPAVFVQSDSADITVAEQLSELLRQELLLRSWWPKSSDDPEEQADYREMQQEWLEDCDAVVLLHGQAKPIKIEQQIQKLWKVQQKRSKPLRLKALYISPPQGKPRPCLADPQFVEIDCSQDAELNVLKLKLVLATLWNQVSP
jgi:hypothetical protein